MILGLPLLEQSFIWKWISLIALFACVCGQMSLAADVKDALVIRYSGTDLPSNEGWQQEMGEHSSLAVTPEGLRIKRTQPAGWGGFGRVLYSFPSVRAQGLEASAQVRTVSASALAAATLLVCDGYHEEYLTFFPDRIYLHRLKQSCPADMAAKLRDIRVVLSVEGLRLFLDGKQVFDSGKKTWPGNAVRAPQVGFGIFNSSSTGESIWKNVTARLVPASPSAQKLPRLADISEKSLLYYQRGVYALFPSFLRDEAGDFYVKASARATSSHMESSGAKPIILRSSDEGRTWEPASQYPVDPALRIGGGRYTRVGAVGWRQSQDATLKRQLEAEGIEVRQPNNSGVFSYAKGWFVDRSFDGGRTWKREQRDISGMALLMNYHEALSTLRVNDQLLMRVIYGKTDAKKVYYEPYLLRSADNGGTWSAIRMYTDPRRTLGFGETAIALAANGDIVVMMREEPSTGTSSLWVARSSDQGLTWTPPAKTPMVGHPAALIPLRDGTLLCTYGYRANPIGIRAAISRDHGKTWLADDIRTVRDDGYGAGGENGYPTTLETSDGSLFTVCYLTDRQGISYIAGTRWRWNR